MATANGTTPAAAAPFQGLFDEEHIAKHFQVVPDGQIGRLPDQVTKGELAAIEQTLSSVQNGTGELVIDTTGKKPEEAAAYRARMMEELTTVMETEAGRGLVSGLADDWQLDPKSGLKIPRMTTLQDGTFSVSNTNLGGNLGPDGKPGGGSDAVVGIGAGNDDGDLFAGLRAAEGYTQGIVPPDQKSQDDFMNGFGAYSADLDGYMQYAAERAINHPAGGQPILAPPAPRAPAAPEELSLDVATDRSEAREELASRFRVVSEEKLGRRPNEVTSAQLDGIAALYSDVRLGRGQLTLGDDWPGAPAQGQAFRRNALGDVATMLQTNAGRAELAELEGGAHQTSIQALHQDPTAGQAPQNAPPDETNGYTNFGDGGASVVGPDGKLSAGPGSDARVNYTAGAGVITPSGTFRSDDVLMHELRHAVDATNGIADARPVLAGENPLDPQNLDVTNKIVREEHQAVGLGLYANQLEDEDEYQRERALIGGDGRGAVPGDFDMPQRTIYSK